jgi:hypothetical protein
MTSRWCNTTLRRPRAEIAAAPLVTAVAARSTPTNSLPGRRARHRDQAAAAAAAESARDTDDRTRAIPARSSRAGWDGLGHRRVRRRCDLGSRRRVHRADSWLDPHVTTHANQCRSRSICRGLAQRSSRPTCWATVTAVGLRHGSDRPGLGSVPIDRPAGIPPRSGRGVRHTCTWRSCPDVSRRSRFAIAPTGRSRAIARPARRSAARSRASGGWALGSYPEIR